MCHVNNTGIEIQPCGVKEPFKLKVVLIGCACDLPARALVLNMMQFNSYLGCNFCTIRGKNVSTSGRGHVQTYPYTCRHLTLRTKESWHDDAEAAKPKSPVSIIIIIINCNLLSVTCDRLKE